VWAVPRRFFQSLPVPCGARSLSVVTNRAGAGQGRGRAAKATAAGGRARCHFY